MNSGQRRLRGWLITMMVLFGCDTAFEVGTAVQSGRQALLRKEAAQALPYFAEAARKDPNYVYRSAHFSEGIWTYVGRCQYAIGEYSQARQSLELALTKDKDDILARLYLGLTLYRSGGESRGQSELRSALQSLHDWIEDLLTRRSAESYWDPNKQIRSETKSTLALLSAPASDQASILANAEWLGAEVEEEIDRARRAESQGRG